MKRILCYGDSNTYGTNPSGGRWDENTRWTGRLQALLGSEYRIIEEGLGGRTTVWTDDLELLRRGRQFLPVALDSHLPLDLVILMLGTNDLKARHGPPTTGDVARGCRTLAEDIAKHCLFDQFPTPKILMISPITIGEGVSTTYPSFPETSVAQSRDFAHWFEEAAKIVGCEYLDAAQFAQPSPIDHLHMDADGHAALAEAIARKVREIL